VNQFPETTPLFAQIYPTGKNYATKKRSIEPRPPTNTHTHVPIKQLSADTPLFRRIIILLQMIL
jgi:hypothetical protein